MDYQRYNTDDELNQIDKEACRFSQVTEKRNWVEYQTPIKKECKETKEIFKKISSKLDIPEIDVWIKDLNQSSMFGILEEIILVGKITIRINSKRKYTRKRYFTILLTE